MREKGRACHHGAPAEPAAGRLRIAAMGIGREMSVLVCGTRVRRRAMAGHATACAAHDVGG